MSANRMPIALAVLLLAVTVGSGPVRATDAKYTPQVVQALADSGDEPLLIWVGFADKGLSAAAQANALDALAAQLPAPVRARRTLRSRGRPLVDAADLPLDAGYLAAVAATGARPRRESRWLNAASFAATRDQITAIAELPFVQAVDLVGRGRGAKPQLSSEPSAAMAEQLAGGGKSLGGLPYGASVTGLAQANITGAHALGLSGAGVTIAILDTGYELGHECFRDLDVVATWDFIHDDEYVGPRKNDHRDQVLYGTAALSALAGYSADNLIGAAYGAAVILAKTEDLLDEIPAEEDNWIAALEWAEGLGADVVVSGLGYYNWYDFADLNGSTALITVAAELAVARGVCVVNAVGDQRLNPEWNHILPPADGRNVLAVGAVDLDDQFASFSGPGPTADGRIKPDLMALGVSTPIAYFGLPDMYYYGNGTSYAVALVAGTAALMLEQNPGLTPRLIGEALRETGSRAQLPDNNFGWGVIDAVAAMNHGSPAIDHTPLTDNEGGTGSYPVTARITSSRGLDESGLWVAWRVAGEAWQMVPMSGVGGDDYTGAIPPQSRTGTNVEYYLVATDSSGVASRLPATAPGDVFTFHVGVDTTPPVVAHVSLADQVPANWPPTLVVAATDNQAVAQAEVIFNPDLNGSGPYYLTPVGDHYELDFPVDQSLVLPGMVFSYVLVTRDTAAIPNLTTSGPYSFSIVNSKGRVLLVDDRANTQNAPVSGRADPAGSATPDKSAADLAAWISAAGFDVDVLPAEQVGSGSFLPYDAVVVSSGSNYGPLNHPELRRTMVAWVEAGGRLVIDGGEVAYAAGEQPGYPDLMGTVLPIESYQGEDAVVLRPPTAMVGHPLLNRPHRITGPVTIDNLGGMDFTAADMVLAATDAIMVLQSGSGTRRGGVVARDDNTSPDAGQVVYLPFDPLRITPAADGQDLIDNVLTYLLFKEAPGTASISGRVTLAGAQDHGGVTVRNGVNQSTVTAADGSFTLSGLWGGTYTITAEADGYAPATRRVVVTDDMVTDGVEFYLLPVVEARYAANPGLSIPDNDPVGVTDAIEVSETGTIHDLNIDVDISHFSVGQLVVRLTSPAGTTVTLRNRTGGTADDLVGNWPASLFVDGPGTLADFAGENPQGAWTLTVADEQLGALGTFNAWGLNLLVVDHAAAAVPAGRPVATRLLGNSPNPFNPRTTIAFELVRSGPVRLDVYDVKGRRVRRLAARTYQAGRHEIVWDGRDERGGETASGLYFFRLLADHEVQTRKMMLVR